jgi:HEAT repeat protein
MLDQASLRRSIESLLEGPGQELTGRRILAAASLAGDPRIEDDLRRRVATALFAAFERLPARCRVPDFKRIARSLGRTVDEPAEDRLASQEAPLIVKEFAAGCLAGRKDRDAIELLERLILSPDPDEDPELHAKQDVWSLRSAACAALLATGAETWGPVFRRILGDPETPRECRSGALQALCGDESQAATRILEELLLRSKLDKRDVRDVARRLAVAGSRPGREALAAYLKEGGDHGCFLAYAAKDLTKILGNESIPAMLAVIEDSESRGFSKSALMEIAAQSGDPRVTPALLRTLQDKSLDEESRGHAAQVLAEHRERNALPILRTLVGDRSIGLRLRKSAAQGLAALDDRQSLQTLVAFLDEVEGAGRPQGRRTLGRLFSWWNRESSGGVEEAPNSWERREAVAKVTRILADWGWPGAIPKLLRMLEVEESQFDARTILEKLPVDTTRGPLLRFLSSGEGSFGAKASAASVLAKWQVPESIPHISRLLEDPRAPPGELQTLIGELGSAWAAPFMPTLVDLLAKTKPRGTGDAGLQEHHLRMALTRVLAGWCTPAEHPSLLKLLADEKAVRDVRGCAAEILGRRRVEAAIPGMMAYLRSRQPDEWDMYTTIATKLLVGFRAADALPGLIGVLNAAPKGYDRTVKWLEPALMSALNELLDISTSGIGVSNEVASAIGGHLGSGSPVSGPAGDRLGDAAARELLELGIRSGSLIYRVDGGLQVERVLPPETPSALRPS